MIRILALLSLLCACAAGAADLTVATFNIRLETKNDTGVRNWEKRKALVVETIRKMNADVFGVQEAKAVQMDYLVAQLPEYESFGVGRDDGKRAGEFSAIFLRRDRVSRDPAEGGTFWLSDTPDKAGTRSWGNQVIRICTWARLIDASDGQGFYFFNTHWDHQHQGSREQSGRLMAQRIDARKHSAEPVLVTGDFNATETNPGVAYLLGKKVTLAGGEEPEQWKNPLRCSLLELHPDEENRRTFNSWKGVKEGKATIDHVLVSPEWSISKAWIEYHHQGEMWPSDHYPVAAVVSRKADDGK